MKYFDMKMSSIFKPLHFELHSKKFFTHACLTASAFFLLSCCFVPFAWDVVYVGCASAVLALVVTAQRHGGEFTVREYNIRYEITIYLGILVTTTSMYLIDETYVLLVPLVLGLLYNSANAYIRSRRLDFVIPLFMLEPFIKVIGIHDTNKLTLEYMLILLLCLAVVAISDGLFRSAAYAKEASEHKRALMQTVFHSLHGLQAHDIRNIACKLQVLALPEYVNDSVRMQAKLSELVGELDAVASTKLFDTPTEVDLRKLVRSIPCTYDKRAFFMFSFSSDDPIMVNKHILYTTLKNVFENSLEAGLRKRMYSKIMLEHDASASVITITDNCGGFDTSRIKTGVSSKPGHGHGTFLSTITDPALGGMFGLRVSVARVSDGTRVSINYNQQLESLH